MSVEIIPIEFLSHDGKHTCSGQLWQEQGLVGEPRGIIQFVHGMAEHIRRYDHFARFLVDQGFVVCGIDHIGHGQSVFDKSEWGQLPVENGPQIMVDDTHQVRLLMEEKYGDTVPYIMYGHSMGSFIVRMYISQYGKGLNGAIISGTGHNPSAVCKAGGTLARTIAARKGNDYYSKTLNSMADGSYAGAIKDARTSFDWLSFDDSVVDAYIADEACGFPFKASGYVALMDMCEYVANQKYINNIPTNLPILFVAGAQDPVGANGKGVRTVYEMFKKAKIDDVVLKIYPDMRHEVHNELNKEKVYGDVVDWIDHYVKRMAEHVNPGETYVIAIDQGTTSTRSVLIDHNGMLVDSFSKHFEQHFPNPGWVEHDANEIWQTVQDTLTELIQTHNLTHEQIDSIGITNQRETTVVWNVETGQPIANAIVWQCRRTADMVQEICGDEKVAAQITDKTGLLPDAYFCASKIKWILDNTPGARELANAGKLAFGTIDSWLLYKLTGGAVHATDYTNASRTMLFDIHKLCWDEWLLGLFDVPSNMLPEVHPSSYTFGSCTLPVLKDVPIAGVVGDQQSALFGQCCFEPGQAKATYGTGCFLLMNTGADAPKSTHGLVTTIAASAPESDHVEYALEGSVLNCATLIQWLRDLGLYEKSYETEELARTVEDTAGVYIVPAFTGLGAPYWDAEARGAILGLTRGVTKAHVARAALEAIAYQNFDLVNAMQADAGKPIEVLNVDGGVSGNNFCMQFQSDILRVSVRRPQNIETTALGAAYLAGLCTGYYPNTAYLRGLRASDSAFEPNMDENTRKQLLAGWTAAIDRVKTK